MRTRTIEKVQTTPVADMNELSQKEIGDAVGVYQRAFANPPYEEAFTDEDAAGALKYILDKNGDLVVGQVDDEVVALCGGYMKPNNVYYIEELAVDPNRQSRGIGRQVLQALMSEAIGRSPYTLEIRTTIFNEKAIALYSSEGFVSEAVTEVVAQTRQDGQIALDERVYLSKSKRRKTWKKQGH